MTVISFRKHSRPPRHLPSWNTLLFVSTFQQTSWAPVCFVCVLNDLAFGAKILQNRLFRSTTSPLTALLSVVFVPWWSGIKACVTDHAQLSVATPLTNRLRGQALGQSSVASRTASARSRRVDRGAKKGAAWEKLLAGTSLSGGERRRETDCESEFGAIMNQILLSTVCLQSDTRSPCDTSYRKWTHIHAQVPPERCSCSDSASCSWSRLENL